MGSNERVASEIRPDVLPLASVAIDSAVEDNFSFGRSSKLHNASTEFLNQSSNDCIDIVQYEERHNAEHYTVLRARTKEIRPVLARLHADGELRPGGVRSGVFVRICLVADKPFIRHVCGLTSHNADAFGAPFCKCCDRDIYKFSFDKKSHYGNVTFEQLCSRAHIPTWQALGQSEPAEWCFECDGCGEVRCSSSSRVLDSPLVISIRNSTTNNTGPRLPSGT